jgi:muconolactone delta-isomerase
MRFLALATSDDARFDALATGDAADLLSAEAARSWELFCTGVIREMSWRTDRRDVVIVLEAADAAAAEAALASLPLVEAGAISFEVLGLRPYDGWARLFAGLTPGSTDRDD